MLGVAAPAHPGLAQPVTQQRQIAVVDAGTRRQRRLLQPGQQLFRTEAALGQRQQAQEGFEQGDFRALVTVGEAEGNPWHALTRGKHGFDIGRIALDIRGQHHHLIRRQLRVVGKARQQLVMQDFHFAQRRVSAVHFQRTVIVAEQHALI